MYINSMGSNDAAGALLRGGEKNVLKGRRMQGCGEGDDRGMVGINSYYGLTAARMRAWRGQRAVDQLDGCEKNGQRQGS